MSLRRRLIFRPSILGTSFLLVSGAGSHLSPLTTPVGRRRAVRRLPKCFWRSVDNESDQPEPLNPKGPQIATNFQPLVGLPTRSERASWAGGGTRNKG
uniref:Secreted protein n=1 Tax=Steinernema glaseri TaxID=37863 RepID=A0A1I7Z386_9BILA